MTPEEIAETLTQIFGSTVATLAPGSYQVETPDFRLLVLLSDDQSWLRVLIPIAPAQDAEPFLAQLMAANFDETQEARYALHQDVLWGVFQHSRESLMAIDFKAAISRLLALQQQGLNPSFGQFVEKQVRQIILVAKRQGQTLEETMQTLDRLYSEGLMGEMDSGNTAREQTLATWRYQLERLWQEVEP
jgi:hypothetical protein